MKRNNTFKRRGSAYLLALLLMVMFSSVAIATAFSAALSTRKTANQRSAASARMAAESGLEFMLERINHIRLPGSTDTETFLPNLRLALASMLDGTINLGAQIVSIQNEECVHVPPIVTSNGTFQTWISPVGADRCRMEVVGAAGQISRRLAIEFRLIRKAATAFNYGVASRGQISVSGNARIIGVNSPGEASIISSTTSSPDAIRVDGSVTLSGDLSVSGDDAYVVITGNPTIAGSRDPDVYSNHIHFGVEPPAFPEVNIQPIADLANGDVITKSVDTSKDLVLTNIRIPAGTNPVFSGKVVLKGVVYIESPNNVTFTGQTELHGLVVAENTTAPVDQCQIKFMGNVESFGVETLPDEPQFAAVKQQTGTFVAAPGFGVTFGGNFSTINGTIAASQLTFSGTAEGTVKGSVLGLADYPTTVGGNVEIRVDRLNANPDAAGFIKPIGLTADEATYQEL